MSINLDSKAAIITGAANGVGLAIAKKFIDAGANVVLADMDEEQLSKEVSSLEKLNKKVISFCGDLREKLTINNLLATTVDRFETIDILVNASRQVLLCDPLNMEENTFNQMMNQNVTVNLRISQAVANRMIKLNKRTEKKEIIGKIVNLSSIAAARSQKKMLSYSVSSAALNQLTKSLAIELAEKGITVNGVGIGSVMSASLRDMTRKDLDLQELIIESTPLGRIGEAEEAAEAVLFLSSHHSNFITGQTILVDGGRSLLDRIAKPAY